MKRVIIISMSFFLLCCEQKPPEPTDLYNKYRKSVVLIMNSYYFKTTLDNGFEFFYTIKNNEPVIHFNDEEAAIEDAGVIFGTGFFISGKGEIATNRHVVYPDKEYKLVGEQINNYLSEIKLNFRRIMYENEYEQNKIDNLLSYDQFEIDYSVRARLSDSLYTLRNKKLELENLYGKLDFNPENTKTEIIRLFLGIVYDDTHVTSQTDFQECVVLKKSENEAIDLAIIQLKDKTTPNSVINIFSLQDLQNVEPLKLSDEVFMIGFNHGISLAYTEEGIKSQFTQGTITQDPDSKRILYSIPTLPGSSGSPIIDIWGNLVAVNFAKTNDFQGFSFGIPVRALVDLYINPNYSSEDYIVSNGLKSKREKTLQRTIDYSDVVISFVKAEDNRDFNDIYSFLSPKIDRYWDLKNPTYSDLKTRYEYLWSFTSNPENQIEKINKINDYTYDLTTTFNYYNQRNDKFLSVNSTVRFLFDSGGKIIEIYGIK